MAKIDRRIKKILEEVSGFKAEVDNISASYLAERKRFEKEIEGMKGTFSESYIREAIEKWKPKEDYTNKCNTLRTTYLKKVHPLFLNLKIDLDNFFQKPARIDFAQTISVLKSLGADVSNREVRLLFDSAGNYWESKLALSLGSARTTKAVETHVEGDKLETKAIDKPVAFYSDIISPQAVYGCFNDFKSACENTIESYCGEKNALLPLVFPGRLNALQHAKISSSKSFDRNHPSVPALSGFLKNISKSSQKPKRVLTEDDTSLIDILVDPNYPTLAKQKVLDLSSRDSHLRELFSLDPRYCDLL